MEFVDFVIDNCVRQNATTPQDYIGMTAACDYAMHIRGNLESLHILTLGRLVNNNQQLLYRTTPATFRNGNTAVKPEFIRRQIQILLAAKHDESVRLTADEFYHRFEEIRPFVDGNGRVGAILYNTLFYMCGEWRNPPEMEW